MKYGVESKSHKDSRLAQKLVDVLRDLWGNDPEMDSLVRHALKVGASNRRFTIKKIPHKAEGD